MDSRLYRALYRIRRVEEEVARVYPSDRIKSPVHLSIGQEAVSVGVCAALEPCDVVFGTYRGHALYLARVPLGGQVGGARWEGVGHLVNSTSDPRCTRDRPRAGRGSAVRANAPWMSVMRSIPVEHVVGRSSRQYARDRAAVRAGPL